MPASPLRQQTVEELRRAGFRAEPVLQGRDAGMSSMAAVGAVPWIGVAGLDWVWERAWSVWRLSSVGRPHVDTGPGPDTASRTHRRRVSGESCCLAAIGGVVAFLVTGWPVAVPIAGVAIVGLPRLLRQTSNSAAITRIEAIATWTEMLQGTLTASAGLGQAIMATAPLAPLPIRAATIRLSARLEAGAQSREALLQFADELDDPSADRVVCALLLATAARAQRLGDLLAALADSTRDEVALRLRIETSRASVRSGVRTVLVFSVSFAVGLVVLARPISPPSEPRRVSSSCPPSGPCTRWV